MANTSIRGARPAVDPINATDGGGIPGTILLLTWGRMSRRGVIVLLAATLPGCALFRAEPKGPGSTGTDPLPVQKAPEEVVVAAWSEPKQLPPFGGQAQIIVRAQRRGGKPFEGVEVRVRTSAGTLFSQGRVLVTDASGRTRDRLTARRDATVTVNAGGTVYRFKVPLRSSEDDSGSSGR
jgi:hypothetical protein